MSNIITTAGIREYLLGIQGQVTNLDKIRREFNILPGSKSFTAVRIIMYQLAEGEQRLVRPTGKPGEYKVVKQVQAISVFGRKRRPEIHLNPPVDRETLEPMDFFNDIVFRAGDFILLSGFKNKGKTGLCVNLASENLDKYPLLMGNEFTIMGKDGQYEPAPRMLTRFDNMDWVQWVDEEGKERFELLPVYQDYSEHVKSGRLNIIDWINIPGEYYMISPVSEAIKQAAGDGIVVGVLQKNPDATYGRGGNPSKDFADVELLLDPYGEDKDMVKLTVETVKESRRPVMGRVFVYRLKKGVAITDFREVEKCKVCYGRGWRSNKPCDNCDKLGFVERTI